MILPPIIISPPFGHYLHFSDAASVKGTYTAFPRPGNRLLRALKTVRKVPGGWVNKIGLANPGVASIRNFNSRNIYSFAIISDPEKEWTTILEKLRDGLIIEINPSCPNTEKNLLPSEITLKLTLLLHELIIKLSPIYHYSFDVVEKAIGCGIDTFHCCNTIPTDLGGRSGNLLKQYSLHLIDKIKEKYPDVTIIGGGGIYTPQDVIDYHNAGAEHFSLATIFFTPWKVPKVIKEIKFLSKY